MHPRLPISATAVILCRCGFPPSAFADEFVHEVVEAIGEAVKDSAKGPLIRFVPQHLLPWEKERNLEGGRHPILWRGKPAATTLRNRQSTTGSRQSAIVNRQFRSQPFFREFKGAEDGSGFILAFLVFAGGDGVGHDSGASLQVGGFVFDEHGSDDNAGGEIAGEIEIEHGAAVTGTCRKGEVTWRAFV